MAVGSFIVPGFGLPVPAPVVDADLPIAKTGYLPRGAEPDAQSEPSALAAGNKSVYLLGSLSDSDAYEAATPDSPNHPRTIAFLFRVPTTPNHEGIFGTGSNTVPAAGWGFRIDSGNFSFRLNDGSPQSSAAVAIAASTTLHAALVTLNGATFQLWFDRLKVGSPVAYGGSIAASAEGVQIGKLGANGGDNFEIGGAVLSATEIPDDDDVREWFDRVKARLDVPALVGAETTHRWSVKGGARSVPSTWQPSGGSLALVLAGTPSLVTVSSPVWGW